MNSILELKPIDKRAKLNASPKAVASAALKEELPVSYRLILLQVALMLGALFVFLVWLFSYLISQRANQELYVNQQLSKAELRELKLALAGPANLAELQASLQDLAWVEGAALTKRASGPKGLLLINLDRAKPLARLANGDYVFSSAPDAKELAATDALPLLRFVDYQAGEEEALSPALDAALTQLHLITAAYDLAIKEFRLSAGGRLEARLANGAVIKVGARQHRERLARLNRFLASYPSRVHELAAIDLRHQHALAVLWSG